MSNALVFPAITLVFWTFAILIRLGKLRFRAVKTKQLNGRYFKLNKGADVPEEIEKTSNNYNSLLALPLLFYVAVVLLIATDKSEFTQIIFAWLFVLSRVAHSIIHTGSNKVRYRFKVFSFGLFMLILMWGLFCVRMLIQ